MVGDADDADLLLQLAERARRESIAAGCEIGEVALGVMLEIPSAILVADSYFGRIGSPASGPTTSSSTPSRWTAATLGLERYRDALHPAILRLVRQAVDASRRSGIDLSICGEMAGDPAAALALVGLGVRSLSMAASSLPAVRRAIRGTRMPALETAAIDALDDPSAELVRARFETFLVGEARA